VIVSVKTARDLVYARSERVCERCGLHRGTNWHHRRAAGRVWTPENGLDLDGSGTTGCHGFVTEHPELARLYGWVVGSGIDPLWVPVLIGLRWCYLTRDGRKVPVRDTSGLPPVVDGFPDLPGLVRAR
jgi:hypothetical protein